MKSYWNTLTSREQLLIMLAGGLLIFTLLYLLVVRPVNLYGQSADMELKRAEALYTSIARIAERVSQLKNQSTPKRQSSGQSVRIILSQSARASGVLINRIQPDTDNALTIWVEGTPSRALYDWLQKLDGEHAIAPVKVSLQKTGSAGLVRAQLQFVEARP